MDTPDAAAVAERSAGRWPAVGRFAGKLQGLQSMLAIQQARPPSMHSTQRARSAAALDAPHSCAAQRRALAGCSAGKRQGLQSMLAVQPAGVRLPLSRCEWPHVAAGRALLIGQAGWAAVFGPCLVVPSPRARAGLRPKAVQSPAQRVMAWRMQACLELLEDDDFQRDADDGAFERMVDEVRASRAAAEKCGPPEEAGSDSAACA